MGQSGFRFWCKNHGRQSARSSQPGQAWRPALWCGLALRARTRYPETLSLYALIMSDTPLIHRASPEGKVKSGRRPHKVTPDTVLAFWFGCPDDPDFNQPRTVWFEKDDAFDHVIRRHFEGALHDAAKGKLDGWAKDAQGTLALVILLDQFSRNLYRDSAQAFAQDERARHWASVALEHGWDQQVAPVQRVFFYLPLEHSEDLDHQHRCVSLMAQFKGNPEMESYYDYAVKHHAVIEEFGRFPHRNAVLGRENTAAEEEHLALPGSGF